MPHDPAPPRLRGPLSCLALLAGALSGLATGCSSDCLEEDCDRVPELPWDPGDGDTEGDGYGYGDDGGDGTDGGDGGIDTAREILSVRDCAVTFSYTPSVSLSSLQIAGEFNDWSPTALSGPDGEGAWSVALGELDPGEYAYKLLPNGEWEGEPPATVYSKWVGGSENRALRVGDCQRPLLQTVSASATPSGALSVEVQIASAADGAAIDPATLVVTVGGEAVSPDFDPSTGLLTLSLSGLAAGKHSVRVWAADEAGRRAENEPLWVPLWVEPEPFAYQDGLLYFVFTDRFRNGDYGADLYDPISGVSTCANYQGGDFQGVIDALDEGYFQALGVRTLWLSPVYDNPAGSYLGTDGVHDFSGYHGYWPTSPSDIEERWGDSGGSAGAASDRLHELVAKAHAAGIRVLFDLVMNHVHEDHSYLDEHPDWFGGGCVCGASGCDWDSHARDCWFTDYLPDLDYRNHEIVETVTDDTLRLLEVYDVDAVRVDAAKHMDHVAMRTLRMRLRDEVEAGGGAPFYVVGETFTNDPNLIMDYVGPTELHGQFDFPLYWSIRSTFVDGGSFTGLEGTVASNMAIYGDDYDQMSPFLGNHDVSRFATALDGVAGDAWTGDLDDPMADGGGTVTEWDLINQQSMALAFTLTQPGVPLLYYGDEIGLHGGEDPDNRRPMSFSPYLSANQSELLERTQVIGAARAESAALRRGERAQLWVDDSLLVYARDNGGGDVAIIAINKGGSARSERVSVSALGVEGATFTDRKLAGRSATVSGGSLTLSLGAADYAILVRE